MRKYLFKKAKKLSEGTKIVGETEHSILFEVPSSEGEPYSVVIQYKNNEIDFTCSCQAQGWDKWCSHKISALTYLTNLNTKEVKNGNKKQI